MQNEAEKTENTTQVQAEKKLTIDEIVDKVAKIVGETAEPLINDSSLFFEQDSTLSVASAIKDAITQKMLSGSDKSLYELDYEDANIPTIITKYEGTGDPHGIYIDPTQKVKLTGILNIGVCLKYKGVIGTINAKISVSLSSAS